MAQPVRYRKVHRDNIRRITDPALKRLAYKAGAKRVSGLLYEELRGILKVHLENILRRAATSLEFDKRKTLQLKDVELALQEMGVTYGGVAGMSCKVRSKVGGKTRRDKPGTDAMRQIKYYQKHADCLMLPKAPFERLEKEIMQDYLDDFRLGHKAVIAVQAAAEAYLVEILREAVKVAIAAGRETVMPKDLQLVRQIRKERA